MALMVALESLRPGPCICSQAGENRQCRMAHDPIPLSLQKGLRYDRSD